MCYKLTQAVYESGVEVCQNNLHGRLVMSKGDTPLTSCDLTMKLQHIWKIFGQWRLISLGQGFFEFQFASNDDKWNA